MATGVAPADTDRQVTGPMTGVLHGAVRGITNRLAQPAAVDFVAARTPVVVVVTARNFEPSL